MRVGRRRRCWRRPKKCEGKISHSVDEAKRYLKETEATIAAALAAGKEAFKKEKTDRA
jgi:hypothetical protein